MTSEAARELEARIRRLNDRATMLNTRWQDSVELMQSAQNYLSDARQHNWQQHERWAQQQLHDAAIKEHQAATDASLCLQQLRSATQELARLRLARGMV